MLRGIRFEDAIKSVVGLAILAAAMVAFGPGLLDRYGIAIKLEAASNPDTSSEHQIALEIENDLPKLDVLNISTLDDRVVMTALDLAAGNWTDEELTKLIEVTFYLVDLAQEEELPIVSQLLHESEAVTIDSEPVEIFIHKETFICPWAVLKYYNGTNATQLIQNCVVQPGSGLLIDTQEIAWKGRGN
ncbi:MAG: hypothetical protein AMJ88_09295 [Anaerolineae bacterium SM23_ 63]|nr:MAG: hypothetical protein AMJ88_09295 [Anaerolineae bacterium SM23_ 63]HEY47186.1 hypothetical protein [Anaerolineae bacterium]